MMLSSVIMQFQAMRLLHVITYFTTSEQIPDLPNPAYFHNVHWWDEGYSESKPSDFQMQTQGPPTFGKDRSRWFCLFQVCVAIQLDFCLIGCICVEMLRAKSSLHIWKQEFMDVLEALV